MRVIKDLKSAKPFANQLMKYSKLHDKFANLKDKGTIRTIGLNKIRWCRTTKQLSYYSILFSRYSPCLKRGPDRISAAALAI